MSANVALKAGRRAAESLMVDAVKITRGGGAPVFNPDTGQYESASVTVYEGKAKFQTTGAGASNPEAGGAVFTVQSLELHIPATAGPVQVDDSVKITTSPLDPARVGNVLRISALFHKTYATAQRLKVEQITG